MINKLKSPIINGAGQQKIYRYSSSDLSGYTYIIISGSISVREYYILDTISYPLYRSQILIEYAELKSYIICGTFIQAILQAYYDMKSELKIEEIIDAKIEYSINYEMARKEDELWLLSI